MLNLLKNIFLSSGKRLGDQISHEPTDTTPAQTAELKLKSEQSTAAIKRGNEYLANGDLSKAAEYYRQAIAMTPNYAEAYVNLGFILKEQQFHEQAETILTRAVQLKPDSVDAHYLFGIVAQQQGKLAFAIERFQNVLALKPDFEMVYGDLCHALFLSSKIDSAKIIIAKALALNSQNAQFHLFQGNLHYHEEMLDKAIASYRIALQLQPNFLQAYINMGNMFMLMGKIQDAMGAYERALAIDPTSIEVESGVLFSKAYYLNISPESYLTAAQRYGQNVSKLAKAYTHWLTYPVDHSNKPLRIGFVSGDFNDHPVAFFLESMLAHLIKSEQLELFAYPSSLKEDKVTARLKPHFAAWQPIVSLNDEAAARKIHADGIHILIDLAGHTSYNRLPMFAWKPAPIQVSWLGYLASTGVSGMDYLLADPISVPEANREHFTETVWYLPKTVNCLTPPAADPRLAITPTPAISNGYITFGSFQNLSKINDTVLNVWGQILRVLPESRLRLQIKQVATEGERAHLLQRLTNVGIAPERVSLGGRIDSREAYLAKHNEVDIILDTFPCPGITTTCEALWMGVPTLTLAGNNLLSRQGASLLNCAGLPDWVASDENDYIARALLFAGDIDQLAQLRAGLRERVLASPLFNAPQFATHLEEAFQSMWQRKLDTTVM